MHAGIDARSILSATANQLPQNCFSPDPLKLLKLFKMGRHSDPSYLSCMCLSASLHTPKLLTQDHILADLEDRRLLSTAPAPRSPR